MRSLSYRPATLLVVPAGVLLGHGLAYSAFGGGHEAAHHVDHGYLALAASLAVPLAVAGMLIAACRPRRGVQPTTVPGGLVTVVVLQAALFVAQEGVEHAVIGHDLVSFLGSPLVWTGLMAQATVAVGLAVAVHMAGIVGGRLVLVAHQRALHRVTLAARKLRVCSWLLPAPATFGRPTGRGPPPSLS